MSRLIRSVSYVATVALVLSTGFHKYKHVKFGLWALYTILKEERPGAEKKSLYDRADCRGTRCPRASGASLYVAV
jgi:hypothetical protein